MVKCLFLLVFFSLSAWADFRVGDIILQPRRCFVCSLIEAQEQSSFSHMSVVVKIEQERVLVADSLTQVRVQGLKAFLSEGDPTRGHKVFRFKEKLQGTLWESVEPLLGAEFDGAFLWDNLGRDGREALYCSEFVTKAVNNHLKRKFPTKPMDYSVNRDIWDRLFGGSAPHGLPGNSPADFEKSKLLKLVAIEEEGRWTWK